MRLLFDTMNNWIDQLITILNNKICLKSRQSSIYLLKFRNSLYMAVLLGATSYPYLK